MNFEIKTGAGCFKNMKYLYSNDQIFDIFINGNKISLPINVAVSFSSSIAKILYVDRSCRTFDIRIDFRNYKSIQRIISIISSQSFSSNVIIDSENDAMDFAEFGYRFGNEEFIKPFREFINKNGPTPLKITNIFNKIKEKEFLSLIDETSVDISEELLFIKKNFSKMCTREEFIDWCRLDCNFSHVEEIVQSNDILLSSEDELLSFIIKINDDLNFTHLFRYVHLEFCSLPMCKKFMKYINSDDFFQSSLSRESILLCLSSKILYNSNVSNSFSVIKDRYKTDFSNNVIENSVWHLKEEIRKKDKEIFNLEVKYSQMQIFIKVKDGKNITLSVKQNDKISDIKRRIYEKEGIAIDNQNLIFAGKILNDNNTLLFYNIQKLSTLYLYYI